MIRLAWYLRASLALVFAMLLAPALPLRADELFRERIEPFAKKFCVSCHNAKQAKGELDLTRYSNDRAVVADFRRWANVVEFIRSGEMPPHDRPQPSVEERNAVVAAVESLLLVEAKKHAGDPGAVLPRRLSHTEYDNSIRDLTGVAIRATAEFPVDPAGGEGFNNTGEALGMTPNLLTKYLGAADFVSKHLVLKPSGLAFAPFAVTSYNERKKFTEQAILDFYRRHTPRLGDYLEAAWRYRHRGEGERNVRIEAWAERRSLSPTYLALVSKTLEEARDGAGYVKVLGTRWQALPPPAAAGGTPGELRDFEKLVAFTQTQLNQKEPGLIKAGAGNWPIEHLAFRAKVAASRDKVNPQAFRSSHFIAFNVPAAKNAEAAETTFTLRLETAFEGVPANAVVLHRPMFAKGNFNPKNPKAPAVQGAVTLRAVLERDAPELARRLKFGKHPQGGELDADSLAVQAPAVLEIPLSKAAVMELAGKQFFTECELDGKASPESAVHLQLGIGKFAASGKAAAAGANVTLLLRPESKLAAEVLASGAKFCAAFPNRFAYVNNERGLAAGFHLVEGFFRDDQPLVNLVLNPGQREELNRLWKDLDFVTQSAETLLRGFVWFERAERHVLHDKRFDFLRSEDPLLVEEELLTKFERVYLEKMGVKLTEDKIAPVVKSDQFLLIHGFFEQIRAGLAEYRQTLQKAEAIGLGDVQRLAERAYCRPLRPAESKALHDLYQQLRKQGQGVEDSLRGTFAAVLMSPHFFYRVPPGTPGRDAQPLADEALARRLSYFLWGSLPDEELLKAARAGKLRDDAGLRAQVRRMQQDPRIETFAREFFGQWLRYRDYLAKDTIPAGTFAGYDEPLRQAMFAEPTRLITSLLQRDDPIDELLHSDATYVNDKLAKFYGGAIEAQHRKLASAPAEWVRVDGLRAAGRGGLFGMAVVLAKNSAGQRTSPVKRGFWVVHHVLGQHFPPPPADVPELPKSEKDSAKTIREMLALHTQNQQCAMCHVHFDALGLTLEGFDAIGRARTTDLAGRPIQKAATLASGQQLDGVAGLMDYVEKHRRADFEKNLCRKFLGYALGRSVLLSDQPLLQDMLTQLQTDRRFSVLFEAVVLSPQFRKQRGLDYTAAAP